jgi:hypothetical protein
MNTPGLLEHRKSRTTVTHSVPFTATLKLVPNLSSQKYHNIHEYLTE